MLSLLPLLFLSLAALAFASSPADIARIRNANHIFNAIHSSMRQWGGSWYHNGMSFFLATVPAGTQFYHGTQKSEPVTGTEWLAFEPEHALGFARPRPRGHPPGKDRQDRPAGKRMTPQKKEQKPLRGDVDVDDERGFLHTYVTAKDLRLLYLDGLSAGKTDMGTLDSQDRILLRDNITSPGFQEYERAALACQIARDDWHGRIDGVLRMEAGFEIILCDFARDLHVVRISRVKGGRRGDPGRGVEGFSTYKAIAARFKGIGGGRVKVNYDHFVTAYTYEELDLFQGGKNKLPRLANFSYDELEPLRKDLSRLVLEHDAAEPSFDWQCIADMIIERYSNELKYLASGNLSSIEALHAEIETLLSPFIDYDLRNATAEAERCATQFIPASAPSETLAARVVYDVSYTICSTLRSVLDEEDHKIAVASVQQLIDYLAWTTWKECPQKCRYNEVCFIPIWPSGTVEDREHPQCRDRPSSEGERYWRGGPGRGPPRDGFDKHGRYDEL